VTCNFDLTVRRVKKALCGLDLWLLVAESKGVNVWCAAGADEFNTHCVVSAVKTSGVEDKVSHRTLILPPLGAPGVSAARVREQTGWSTKWGPVYAKDIPRYMAQGFVRDDTMKRAAFGLKERLDTGMGSLFPIYLLGAAGILVFGRHLLVDYLIAGAIAFTAFLSLCPWIPGKKGATKVLFCDALLMVLLLTSELFLDARAHQFRAPLIIAMVMVSVYGLELGGLASTMPSDLDPFLAKLGLGAIGNVAFAGTMRTELLNGFRVLTFDRQACKRCGSCAAVCPQGVWEMDDTKRALLAHKEDCTACRACLVQCESGAIQAPIIETEREAVLPHVE
jgi:NAD-dependent dihydropyrimidine dehydrogenase PreA subunit